MNIIKLNATASTNTFLKELAIGTNLENLTVVTTQNQFQGKGQRGNGWQSEDGKNLTFSVFVKDFVSRHDDLFLLNIVVPLCVLKALKKIDEKHSYHHPGIVNTNILFKKTKFNS